MSSLSQYPCLNSSRRRRILVTGANGYIGKALCDRLVIQQIELIQAVRHQVLPAQFEVGEIGPETNWGNTLEGCDTVIHLAAKVHDESQEIEAFRRVNVAGSVSLAKAAATAGVKRFVFISSAGVHGATTGPGITISESIAPEPHNAYTLSKWEAELSLSEIALKTGMELVVIRPPLVYGPFAPGNFGMLKKWILRGIPLPFASVNNRRAMIALDNLVDFIALCGEREQSRLAANQIFLISDGEDISTPTLLKKIAIAYGRSPRIFRVSPALLESGLEFLGKKGMATSLLGSFAINSLKACDLLRWKPLVSMDEQLFKMAKLDRA